MNIDWDHTPEFNSWLISNFEKFPGLYELDVSDNGTIKVDVILREVQTGPLTNL